MGIDLSSFNDKQLGMMPAETRKQFGKAGRTSGEALAKETLVAERKIHDQFTGFCNRHDIDIWHSNPVRKSSIGEGLPDFLCWKGGMGVAIEFKVWPNTLSKVQEQRMIRLLSHGNPTFVCTETPTNSALAEAIELLTKYFDLKLTNEDQ